MRSGLKVVEGAQPYNLSVQDKADQIKVWLTDLGKAELLEIEFLAKYLRAGKRTEHLEVDAELIYQSIKAEVNHRYKQNLLPWTVFVSREPKLYEKLETVTNATAAWVRLIMQPHVLSRAHKVQLYGIFTELVADELESAGIVVIPDTILTFYERLPSLVDKYFPDYTRSGLMYTLLLWR